MANNYRGSGMSIEEWEEQRSKMEEELKMLESDKGKYSLLDGYTKLDNRDKDPGWIQTFTGKKFYPLDPRIEDICIEDMAHALSMLCRFTGHSSVFYGVAQHCVFVSYLCNDADAKHALLHDASEAYISDLNSVLKRFPELEGYRKIEKIIQSLIYRKFGLSEIEPPSVKKADLMMLGIEAKCLLNSIHPDWKFPVNPPPFQITALPPNEAEKLFLDRCEELGIK